MRHQTSIPHEAEGLVLFLLRQGSKADAIRIYQEEAGIRRTEAKLAVENLARRHGIVSSELGIADLILFALIATFLVLGFAFC